MRIDLPIIVACPNVKGHGNERAKEEWDFSGKQGHQAYCHRYVCIYIYIYIYLRKGVWKAATLPFTLDFLIHIFYRIVSRCRSEEIWCIGHVMYRLSHNSESLYMSLSHMTHGNQTKSIYVYKRSHKKIYIRGMCNNFPWKSVPTMRVIIFTFTSWIWKYFKFLSCG